MNKEDTIPEGKVKRSCQLKLIYKMSLVMSVMLESFLAFLGSSKQLKEVWLTLKFYIVIVKPVFVLCQTFEICSHRLR